MSLDSICHAVAFADIDERFTGLLGIIADETVNARPSCLLAFQSFANP